MAHPAGAIVRHLTGGLEGEGGECRRVGAVRHLTGGLEAVQVQGLTSGIVRHLTGGLEDGVLHLHIPFHRDRTFR